MTKIRQIIRDLHPYFSKQVRERGERYHSGGRVELAIVDADYIEADVAGTLEYKVIIRDHHDGTIETACDCPAGDETGGRCKHVWATLLEAQKELDPAPLRRPAAITGLATRRQRVKAPEVSNWKRPLTIVEQQMTRHVHESAGAAWPEDRRIVYLLDLDAHNRGHEITLEAATQQRGRNGQWKQPKRFAYRLEQWLASPDEADRALAELLHGAESSPFRNNLHRFTLTPRRNSTLLRRLCETGRFYIRHDGGRIETTPLTWDDGPPWHVAMKMSPTGRGGYTVQGELRRAPAPASADGNGSANGNDSANGDAHPAETMELSEPLLFTPTLLVARKKIQRFEDDGGFAFATALRDGGPLRVPSDDLDEFLTTFYRMPRLPRIALPEGMDVEEIREPLKPQLKITRVERPDYALNYKDLQAELRFAYGDQFVAPQVPQAGTFDTESRKVVVRDLVAEQDAMDLLQRLGFVRGWVRDGKHMPWGLDSNKLPKAVIELMLAGWHVEAEGNVYRQPGEVQISASSGIDWFDVQGSVDYGSGQRVGLPALLDALRRGERTVVLDDGSVGLLPEQWLKQHAPVLNLAEEGDDDSLRFRRGQVGVLDALLAAEPQATCDEAVQQARRQLMDFSGIAPASPPETFVGELRPYQRDGLGWLEFLQQFGFGGCLADDMGLGKTVQVLAMLERRRTTSGGPSLVIAPRSLIFNWKQEAARFTPQMRVLDFTGLGRHSSIDGLEQHDLVLTTYGTLRRDADMLKDIRFDYVVLDEAQAIKNASTASAKATRLLKADHRLALSGTPVENRLDDLWSIFEFLNPGMLGTLRAFKGFSAASNGEAEHSRAILSRVMRPFILRRTKAQVATDLPEKSEQTIYCELDVKQRKLYDELRDHYRATLLGQIDRVGMNKSKIMVLEALLRLRQAACHPALVNPKHADAGSAKIEAMLEQVNEALSEGHKVLVFSQFTKLLSIVRKAFDDQQVSYEYLDGRTRDRQEKVERFQNDPDCKLFLISLKAGGLGLNLTAADYVFLLDPWWNPAVEAQAIDRSHRIGQTRPVFAYRLIARDTVEEKVLELQNSKRELAEAIITADNSLISRLSRDDLQLLLS